MITNYLKIALRNAWRNKGYTLINVIGLSTGIMVCLIIFLWVRHETSYEQFHENAENIYRVISTQKNQAGINSSANVGFPYLAALDRLPGAERIILTSPAGIHVTREDLISNEDRSMGSSNVFDVFSFQLLRGDPETVLEDPFSVVLSEPMVQKYFGFTDPIGEYLKIGDHEYRVTGVFESLPSNSRLQFDFLTSWSTQRQLYGDQFFELWMAASDVYLMLDEEQTPEAIEVAMANLLEEIRPENVNPTYEFSLLPLTDIYLYSEGIGGISNRGDLQSVYLYSTISVLILLIAVINYMSLATARASGREKEVGIRKVVGAYRNQLIGQFLGESVLLTSLAFVVALFFLEIFVPFLSSFLQMDPIAFSQIGLTGYAIFTGAVFGIGILAGSYPAFVLSTPGPVSVIKSQTVQGTPRSSLVRKGLVVSQFACSTALILATVIVFKQLDYVKNSNLGFDQEQVVTMPVSVMGMIDDQPFRERLLQDPRIVNASFSFSKPGVWIPETQLTEIDGQSVSGQVRIKWFGVDYDFNETFDLQLAEGRTFSENYPTDETGAFILNQTAVQVLGLNDPVGQQLQLDLNDRSGEVIGVVRDFHYTSLREPIEPMVMYISPIGSSNLSVRIQSDDISGTLNFIRNTWEEFYPDEPFEYTFLDQEIMNHYRDEERFGKIAGGFSILAIVIACLGLFGLAAYTAQQRTKEIGIRKVMGATVANIIALLNKDFIKLVIIGFLIATPIAWHTMNRWLEDFAYKIDIGPGIFLLAGLAAVLIALATVSWQSVRAALANPVDSLRSE